MNSKFRVGMVPHWRSWYVTNLEDLLQNLSEKLLKLPYMTYLDPFFLLLEHSAILNKSTHDCT